MSKTTEWILVPRKLTFENGAKYALIGEFYETVEDAEGNSHYFAVSWTTIKEIHNAVVKHFETQTQTGKCPVCKSIKVGPA